jgi:formylglycine-generating enzyme required for sulfatase activity
MVFVPTQEFEMGARRDDEQAGPSEKPRRVVRLTRPFYIDVAEVSNKQWNMWVGVDDPRYKEGRDDEPVTGITWGQARDFAAWLGVGLPSEAQWEVAARAGTTARYWWGADDDVGRRNGFGGADGFKSIAPCGSFGQNAWGLVDVCGNVAELCEDTFHGDYFREMGTRPKDFTDKREGPQVTVRGGSWSNNDLRALRLSARTGFPRAAKGSGVGFRCALEIRRVGKGSGKD